MLEKMEILEENHLIGYLQPMDFHFENEDGQLELIYQDEFAQKMLRVVLGLLLESCNYQLFQLKNEEFHSMADWELDTVLEALYLALTEEIWSIYLYLEDQESLIVLEDSLACPVYSSRHTWIEDLKDLANNQNLVLK